MTENFYIIVLEENKRKKKFQESEMGKEDGGKETNI